MIDTMKTDTEDEDAYINILVKRVKDRNKKIPVIISLYKHTKCKTTSLAALVNQIDTGLYDIDKRIVVHLKRYIHLLFFSDLLCFYIKDSDVLEYDMNLVESTHLVMLEWKMVASEFGIKGITEPELLERQMNSSQNKQEESNLINLAIKYINIVNKEISDKFLESEIMSSVLTNDPFEVEFGVVENPIPKGWNFNNNASYIEVPMLSQIGRRILSCESNKIEEVIKMIKVSDVNNHSNARWSLTKVSGMINNNRAILIMKFNNSYLNFRDCVGLTSASSFFCNVLKGSKDHDISKYISEQSQLNYNIKSSHLSDQFLRTKVDVDLRNFARLLNDAMIFIYGLYTNNDGSYARQVNTQSDSIFLVLIKESGGLLSYDIALNPLANLSYMIWHDSRYTFQWENKMKCGWTDNATPLVSFFIQVLESVYNSLTKNKLPTIKPFEIPDDALVSRSNANRNISSSFFHLCDQLQKKRSNIESEQIKKFIGDSISKCLDSVISIIVADHTASLYSVCPDTDFGCQTITLGISDNNNDRDELLKVFVELENKCASYTKVVNANTCGTIVTNAFSNKKRIRFFKDVASADLFDLEVKELQTIMDLVMEIFSGTHCDVKKRCDKCKKYGDTLATVGRGKYYIRKSATLENTALFLIMLFKIIEYQQEAELPCAINIANGFFEMLTGYYRNREFDLKYINRIDDLLGFMYRNQTKHVEEANSDEVSKRFSKNYFLLFIEEIEYNKYVGNQEYVETTALQRISEAWYIAREILIAITNLPNGNTPRITQIHSELTQMTSMYNSSICLPMSIFGSLFDSVIPSRNNLWEFHKVGLIRKESSTEINLENFVNFMLSSPINYAPSDLQAELAKCETNIKTYLHTLNDSEIVPYLRAVTGTSGLCNSRPVLYIFIVAPTDKYQTAVDKCQMGFNSHLRVYCSKYKDMNPPMYTKHMRNEILLTPRSS